MWGSRKGEPGQEDVGKQYVTDLARHNINVIMEMVAGGPVAEFLKSQEGHELMQSFGIKRMISEPGKGGTKDPWGFFLTDDAPVSCGQLTLQGF
jgi:hypothetical protein